MPPASSVTSAMPADLGSPATIREAVVHIERLLANAGIEDARLEAELLLAHTLNLDRTRLLARFPEPLSGITLVRLGTLVERRLKREPLAYLLGWREFYGLRLAVRPGVLVPRPETETLVDEALRWASTRGAIVVADVGCGSGAVALALATHMPRARVIALDLSPIALDVTMANRAALGLTGRVDVRRSDLLDALETPVDLVVANLPYVRSDELPTLQPEVRREPVEALDGGPDGLRVVRRLVAQLSGKLRPGGAAMLECDPRQAAVVAAELARALPAARVRVTRDLAGRERVVGAELA